MGAAALALFVGVSPCRGTPPGKVVHTARPGHLELAGMRVLTTRGGRLDWGPRGRIVFDRRGRSGPRKGLYDLWVVDPRRPGTERCVSDVPGLPLGHRGNPSWHPSGKWILFQAAIKKGLVTHPGAGVANELWVIRPDGSDPRRIFAVPGPKAFDGALHPHFDHDGDRVVFSRFRKPLAEFEICVLPFDAADPRVETPVPVLPAGDARWQPGTYETHGFTPDDRHVIFTGCPDPRQPWQNDILVADPTTRDLVDQVTDGSQWDEHGHPQPGTRRMIYSSARDLKKPGWTALDSRADWWVREEDGTQTRLTRFEEEDWPLRRARGPDGSPLTIDSTALFAADGAWSPDGKQFAGVLLFREWRAREWIVILDLAERAAADAPASAPAPAAYGPPPSAPSKEHALAPLIRMKSGAYNPWTKRCSDPKAPVRRTMIVRQPAGPGPYPAFLFLVGTLRKADSATARRLVERAAARGFVAAAVDYDTIAKVFRPEDPCDSARAKVGCSLRAGAADAPEAALNLLCSNRKLDGSPAGLRVDCDQGIVLAGFSQGAHLAMLGRDLEPRVRAVWAMGFHRQAIVDTQPFRCLHGRESRPGGTRALPSQRLRVLVGEGDWVMRGPHRPQLEALTGRRCGPGATQCFAADGSGWMVIPNAECGGKCKHEYLDSEAFWDPRRPWGAEANLDWLAGFVEGAGKKPGR